MKDYIFADLIEFLHGQQLWSEKTFGPGYHWKRCIKHIRKELNEIELEPNDLVEWIDVILIAFDGARRAGHSPEKIVSTLLAKQMENEIRDWPDWKKADKENPIEHIKKGD